MLIFEIDRFWILNVSSTTIRAKVGWPDDGRPNYDANEEVQDIEWDVQYFQNIQDALQVSEFLFDAGYFRGDKILIDKDRIYREIGWEKARTESAIDTLLRIKVDMLDDGEKSDYFFIHF